MTPEQLDLVDAIAAAADEIANVLEGARGLWNDRHQEHLGAPVRTVKKVLATFFRRQGAAILAAVEPNIVSHIEQFRESQTPAGKRFAKSVLPDSVSPLRFAVTDGESEAYNTAITLAIEGAAKVVMEELKKSSSAASVSVAPSTSAGSYLRDNSLSKLTGNIADATKDKLRSAIGDAWDAGGSYDQIVKAIQDTVETFSSVRAGMIAQTEVVNAYNASRTATARAAGFGLKSWETESGAPCETCLENEAAGWIGIEDVFPDGSSGPSAHPNCQCVLNFKTGGTDESDED
jgi:hypothetical protein